MTMAPILFLLVILVMGVCLFKLYQRDHAKTIQAKLHLFDSCMDVLHDAKLSPQGVDFPKLRGQYDGFDVLLELVADTLAVRKVPPLWLLVTIKGNCLTKGSLDLIVRPQNNEFYSPAWQWSGHLQAPDNWPAHSMIKYQDEPAAVEVLNKFVPLLFADERMKELLVLPSAVRITYMAKQAERGEYMLMRNSIFDAVPLEKELVQRIIMDAIRIRKALENT